jgi:hypothetical protein
MAALRTTSFKKLSSSFRSGFRPSEIEQFPLSSIALPQRAFPASARFAHHGSFQMWQQKGSAGDTRTSAAGDQKPIVPIS